MAPSAVQTETQSHEVPSHIKSSKRQPLRATGSLDQFEQNDVTPAIGREFATANIVNDILNATNSDELLRDLAYTISARGVVFFRKQDNLTNELQKQFVQRLGEVCPWPPSCPPHR